MSESIYEKIRSAVGKAADAGSHLNAAKTAEAIAKRLGLSESMIQFTHIELRNAVYESDFKKAPFSERILFLPHCPRKIGKCKATQNGEGYECRACGCCDIDKAIKMAKKIGYKRIFIVPGGSMVKAILDKYKPKAAIGVCCFHEAIMTFDMLKNSGVAPQIVLLLKAGCKDTEINLNLLEEKLKLIDPQEKKK